jgi:DNA-binding response OmpR family regulator
VRVLTIEDEAEIAEAISLCLQLRWPAAEVVVVAEGSEGVAKVKSGSFDIVILDINLPDMDGFEVLSRIRSLSSVPTLIVSVRGRGDERTKGLEMGADDYIVKPFEPRDLVARVNAVLRRSQTPHATAAQPRIVRGELSLDLANDEAKLAGRSFRLTPTESRLLYALMDSDGETVTWEEISREVWGKPLRDHGPLRTTIRRLRNKLGDNPPQMIVTDRGIGYKLVTRPSAG